MLRDLMYALDSVAAEVRLNKPGRYKAAVEYARKVGATDEQIRDAYGYAAHQRLVGASLPPVGFDAEGKPR